MQYWESYSDLAVSIIPSDSEINLDMNGAYMRPWHCMGMAQNQAFGTESVKGVQVLSLPLPQPTKINFRSTPKNKIFIL